MGCYSDTFENALIDWIFRGQAAPVLPAALHIALLTTLTDDDASPLTEVSGGGYARVSVTRSLANFAGTQGAGTTVASNGTSGATSNNVAITFPAPSGNWGQVVGLAVMDAANAGNMLMYAPLAAPKNVNAGDPAPSFPAGTFAPQVDN